MSHRPRILALVAGLAANVIALAATIAQPPPTTADDYFARGLWGRAADAYQRVVETEPGNGQAWYRLGACYHNLERFERSARAYAVADSLEFAPPVTRYNAACLFAKFPEKHGQALDLLESSVNSRSWMENDADLDPLRDHPRFKVMLDSLAD